MDCVLHLSLERRLSITCSVLLCLVSLPGMSWAESKAADSQFVDIPEQGEVHFTTTEKEDQVPARFHLEPHSFPFTCEFKRMSGPVKVYDVTFPSPVKTDVKENNTVHGHYYQPEGPGPFPACVCLHILGGRI